MPRPGQGAAPPPVFLVTLTSEVHPHMTKQELKAWLKRAAPYQVHDPGKGSFIPDSPRKYEG